MKSKKWNNTLLHFFFHIISTLMCVVFNIFCHGRGNICITNIGFENQNRHLSPEYSLISSHICCWLIWPQTSNAIIFHTTIAKFTHIPLEIIATVLGQNRTITFLAKPHFDRNQRSQLLFWLKPYFFFFGGQIKISSFHLLNYLIIYATFYH